MLRKIFTVGLVVGLLGGGLALASPHIGGEAPPSSLQGFTQPEPDATHTPPGHQENPGKKKGCSKGSPKAKKKGCHKSIKPAADATVGSGEHGLQPCAPHRFGAIGRGAPTYKLTDAHGYFSPIRLSFEQPGGVKTGLPTDEETGGDRFFNIQVEPSSSQTGLWARLAFEERRDYDLVLYDNRGNVVASSNGFNPAHEEAPALSPESAGGQSTNRSETLRGIRSDRCAGYTLNVSSAAAEGGEVTLKLWLGPVAYTPPSAKRK